MTTPDFGSCYRFTELRRGGPALKGGGKRRPPSCGRRCRWETLPVGDAAGGLRPSGWQESDRAPTWHLPT